MFRESLLESSRSSQGRKRWTMAAAFLLESVVAGVIVMVPLLSTGIIPVSAHVPIIAPLRSIEVATHPPHNPPSGNKAGTQYREVVAIPPRPGILFIGHAKPDSNEDLNPSPYTLKDGSRPDGPPGDLARGGNTPPPAPPPPKKPLPISEMSAAMLVHKVEPVYPHLAKISGIAGTVKLHAIIGRDGSIQSLSLISGQPILAEAALDAVEKWRYRPYLLNGEAVEVETFITVNFRKAP